MMRRGTLLTLGHGSCKIMAANLLFEMRSHHGHGNINWRREIYIQPKRGKNWNIESVFSKENDAELRLAYNRLELSKIH